MLAVIITLPKPSGDSTCVNEADDKANVMVIFRPQVLLTSRSVYLLFRERKALAERMTRNFSVDRRSGSGV
jgi:hypothetical protein